MSQNVTIREVAEGAGVSISTVHQALNGKSGVSEATRARVCQVAKELGYQPNAIASSLKRKTRRIAVLLPGEGVNNRYYYPPVWRGVRDCLATVPDRNLECIELSYFENNGVSPDVLERLHGLIDAGRVDGLLTVGHMNGFSADDWQHLAQKNIAVVLIGSENAGAESLCCIQPNYEVIGRTMAELILSHIPPFGSIVLCGGNPEWQAHAQVVQGFDAYLEENHAPNRIYREHSWEMTDSTYRRILHGILRPDVAACCSVLSQSSVLLGRALEESGKAGKVFAVGSDLSEENNDRLRRRIFDNVIQKNPYAQGYLGAKALVEYLVRGKMPEQPVLYVGCDVVFRSNLVMYDNGGYRVMML